MANKLDNLRKFTSEQSHEEAVKNGRKGGIMSGEKRAQRKTIRESLLILLCEQLKDNEGNATGKTTQDAVIAGVIKKAIKGDIRAAEFIRDTIGEKPVENVKVTTANKSIMNEIRKRMEADAP